jgi:methyl-accepting chemotaxis protein
MTPMIFQKLRTKISSMTIGQKCMAVSGINTGLMLAMAFCAYRGIQSISEDNSRILSQEVMTVSDKKPANDLVLDPQAKARSTLGMIGFFSLAAIVSGTVLSLAVARGITRSLRRMVQVVSDLNQGEGDLTKRLPVHGRDELALVAQHFNLFIDQLHELVSRAKAAAEQVTMASQQLAASAEQLSAGSQEQASSLEETAASLEEITSSVKQNADNAQQANQLAIGSQATAEKGGTVVQSAVTAMNDIHGASKKITEIIAAIDEIAFQTNLLALNAAVEAVRAGEQGRGFAVVAAEVRSLAQRSAGAAKEIKRLIGDSVRKIDAGSDLVGKSGKTLGEIVASVRRVTDLMAEIAATSQEQSTGIIQVNRAIAQMDSIVQQNSAQNEEMTSTAQSLMLQAKELQSLIGHFKLATNGHVALETKDRQLSLPIAARIEKADEIGAALANGEREKDPRLLKHQRWTDHGGILSFNSPAPIQKTTRANPLPALRTSNGKEVAEFQEF